MPEAIGLGYCTAHQVYISGEDSADSGLIFADLLLVSGSELTEWSQWLFFRM